MTTPVPAPDPELVASLERAQAAGFLGPGPVEPHIAQAAVFAAAAGPAPRRMIDLGSGGGVPGLPLARTWTTAEVVLLDSQARRVRFLTEELDRLGLAERVGAVHARAEDLAHDPDARGAFDLVTARSFGPPAMVAECAAGFLRQGGLLLVSEPPGAPDRWPADGLSGLRLADAGLVTAGDASVRCLRSLSGPPDGVPRRAAAMARRPAF